MAFLLHLYVEQISEIAERDEGIAISFYAFLKGMVSSVDWLTYSLQI